MQRLVTHVARGEGDVSHFMVLFLPVFEGGVYFLSHCITIMVTLSGVGVL